MAKKFSDATVALNRIRGCKAPITIDGKLITITKNAVVGIKTWGAIDYLTGIHGYIWRRTE